MAIPGATNREKAAQHLLHFSGGTGAGAEMARSVIKQAEVLKKEPDSPAARQIEQQIIQQTAKVYAEASTTGNEKGALTYQQLLQEQANYLAGKGVSTPEIENFITKGIDTGIKSGNAMIAGTQPSGFGTAVNVALGIGQALATSGMGLQQQIVFNSAAALIQGAKPQDVVRVIVATVAADQIPKVLGDINKTIVNATPQAIQSTVKSALVNAERQAIAAAITKQDVAKNALAGAVGGVITDVAKYGFDDPITQKAIGEYSKYIALGLSPQDAAALAASDYAVDVAVGESKKSTGGMLPTTAKAGSRIGSLLASTGDIDLTVPPEIAANEQFKTMPGEVGENIIKYTDKDGIVTYQKRVTAQTPLGSKIGYTIIYDPKLNEFQYEYYTRTAEGTETISSKTKPSLTTPNPSKVILPSRLAGTQTGQRIQSEDFGVPTVREQPAPSVEEMPTLSLLRRVRTGQETRQNEAPLQVDVSGGAGFDRGGELAPQESVAQRDAPETQRLIQPSETESSRRVDEEEEPVAQREPSETIILDLISGGRTQATRQQRTPSEREAASMQALSQALSIGDPGGALFGSGLGRRRNVWNVESLRLKDELGG
jgi:hypothetical protein